MKSRQDRDEKIKLIGGEKQSKHSKINIVQVKTRVNKKWKEHSSNVKGCCNWSRNR